MYTRLTPSIFALVIVQRPSRSDRSTSYRIIVSGSNPPFKKKHLIFQYLAIFDAPDIFISSSQGCRPRSNAFRQSFDRGVGGRGRDDRPTTVVFAFVQDAPPNGKRKRDTRRRPMRLRRCYACRFADDNFAATLDAIAFAAIIRMGGEERSIRRLRRD